MYGRSVRPTHTKNTSNSQMSVNAAFYDAPNGTESVPSVDLLPEMR